MRGRDKEQGGGRRGGVDPAHARLERVLDEVERLCAELDELSVRQGAELDAGRAEEAASVVASRARVVARLESAARDLGGDAAGFERLVGSAPEGLAERARKQAAEIASVVARVLARDEEDRELLAAERDRLSQEIGGLGRGRAALDAYGGGATPDPTMQDRRG